MKKHLILFLFFISISSVSHAVIKSAIKQFPEPKPDKALVYVIRPSNFMGSARTEFIYCDQTFMGAVDDNTYTYAYVDPGYHLVWTNWTSVQKNMEFVAGQTYYLEIFMYVKVLDEVTGANMVRFQIPNYATPKDSEYRASEGHIKNRYGRAVKKMGKEDYAPAVASHQSPVPEMAAPSFQPGAVALPANTSIRLKLLENVTSFYNKAGDEIFFEVNADVVTGGQTLIAKGTLVKGTLQYLSDGKVGGLPGSLDVIVPSVKAVDGAMIPLIGQVSTVGNDRTTQAAVWGLYVKRRQAYLLAPQTFEIKTRSEAWIRSTPINSGYSLMAETTTSSSPVLIATVGKPVLFQPHSKKPLDDIEVKPPQQSWTSLQLDSIGGQRLPNPVQAQTYRQKGSERVFVFKGWDVLRHVPFMENKTSYELGLKGQDNGTFHEAKALLEISVKAK